MSAYATVPSTIAYANEEVTDPIYFEWHNHEYRLTYVRSRRGDWMHGIVLGRVKDLRNMSRWSCIPKALEECPMLQEDATLCTVASVTSAGVLADLYAPGIDPIVPVLTPPRGIHQSGMSPGEL
ncbi:hypothetical protein [Nonomuraea basaltis]|uniref:hypothetical protein n=1 Tax=Nonomuraea basaltis TaxID=2495887 RepID=UPI00110C5E1B|nr:hypothetical protein [Nonomuraea basaltis]TMR97157.1 hypothetical protein EJK15_19310 [Nonomuraea basaltis]